MKEDVRIIYEKHKDDIPKHKKVRGESLAEWCDRNGHLGEILRKNFTGINYDTHERLAIDSVARGSRRAKYIMVCSVCGEIYISRMDSLTRINREQPLSCGCSKCGSAISSQKRSKESLYSWCMSHGKEGKRILRGFTGIGVGKDAGKTFTTDIPARGTQRMKWRCRKGHEWESILNNVTGGHWCKDCRTIENLMKTRAANVRKSGSLLDWCEDKNNPYGKQVKEEFTGIVDFKHPGAKRSKYARYIVDGKVDIGKTPYAAGIPLIWRCSNVECNNEWTTTIAARTTRGTGCNECARQRSSVPEAFVRYSLQQVFPSLQANIRIGIDEINDRLGFDIREIAKKYTSKDITFFNCEMEYDIYIPEINLYIEYGTGYTHGNKMALKDSFKDEYATTILGANFISIMNVFGGETDGERGFYRGDNVLEYNSKCWGKQQTQELVKIVKHICRQYGVDGDTIASIDYNIAHSKAMERVKGIKPRNWFGKSTSKSRTKKKTRSMKMIKERDQKIIEAIQNNPDKKPTEIADMFEEGVTASTVKGVKYRYGLSKQTNQARKEFKNRVISTAKEHPELSADKIAELLGVEKGKVRGIIYGAGLRKRDSRSPEEREILDRKVLNLLTQEEDTSFQQIADMVGTTRNDVKRIAKNNNISRRSKEVRDAIHKRNREIAAYMKKYPNKTVAEYAKECNVTESIIFNIRHNNGFGETNRHNREDVCNDVLRISEEHPEMSSSDISQMTGLTIHQVHNIWRGAGYNRTDNTKRIRDQKVIDMISDNPEITNKELADLTGYCTATIHNIRKRNNLLKRKTEDKNE